MLISKYYDITIHLNLVEVLIQEFNQKKTSWLENNFRQDLQICFTAVVMLKSTEI